MKKYLASAAVIALMSGAAGTAAAEECRVTNAEYEQQVMENPDLRASYTVDLLRDIRELRDAAHTLAAYGKIDACQNLAETINTMVENPEELQRDMLQAEAVEPAAYTFDEAQELAQTESQLRVDQMLGADVRGQNNEVIGEISDVVISPTGESAYAIVAYGGFLGIGEEESAVPFDVLKASQDGEVFFLPMTEEKLEGAPRFVRGDFEWSADQEWLQQNDAFYRNVEAGSSN
ncbi:PRC-barrel domain-containing protein [Algihabitans albus]|uniref:PRC-barrel domain-containing protein n=1 Tax=Algihabitans albus TaxID=2164067 RepID=UPI0013C30368|nr:PRC-barrel domain-containing protein [Algihabitans albus]